MLHRDDGVLSGLDPSSATCKGGRCLAKEINNGKAFEIDDVHCDRDDHRRQGGMRSYWSVPLYNDGTDAPRSYDVWRRPHGATAFVRVATVGSPDIDYDYDVVPVD